MSTHPQKHVAPYYWWPIIDSFKKWVVVIPKPQLIIWYNYFYNLFQFIFISINLFQFQISLIDRVHKIYNDTVWQDRSDQEGFKGMGFVIKKIVVHSEPTRLRGGEAHYNMIREKWDVRNLLEVSRKTYFFYSYKKIKCKCSLHSNVKFSFIFSMLFKKKC